LIKELVKIDPSNEFIELIFFILACNVVYLNNVDVESLSGQMAVAKALRSTFDNAERLQATIVSFKVSNTGITLGDTNKK
jgi:tensin